MDFVKTILCIRHVLIWAVVVLTGPTFLSIGLRFLYLEIRPRRWRKVSAIVTRSEIEHQTSGKAQQYIPIVEYQYKIDGAAIRDRGKFFNVGTYRSAVVITKLYPIDMPLSVLVNPRKPQQSSLGARVTQASCFFILLGGVFTVVEIIFHTDLESNF